MTPEPPAPRATLVSRHSETFGTIYPLEADELIIGRAQDAGLLLENATVSRRHARISWNGNAYVLEDMESKNGTWINDRPVAKAIVLNDGDVIRFGDLPFVFTQDASATMTLQSAPSRSLATILFTDMASSTALTQRLGDAGAQEVRRVHNDIVRGALSSYGGSEIKHTGDGIMASFSAASSALDAAIAIQRGVAEHREANPGSPLQVYVGLNAGEPIGEEDDLFGTSINLAARICDHAQPDQILAADVVRQLAAGKDFLFADLGETELRGFEDPVKLWELSWHSEA